MITRPTIVFTTGWDPFQALINLGTFSRAGHAAIGIGDHLLHAYEPGVVWGSRDTWFTGKHQRLIAEYEILPDVSEGIEDCASRIGEPYDVVGVFRAALWIMLRRLCSPLRHVGTASAASHTCSSFVMLLDPNGDRIPEWRSINRAVVTPADLLLAAEGPSFRPILRQV